MYLVGMITRIFDMTTDDWHVSADNAIITLLITSAFFAVGTILFHAHGCERMAVISLVGVLYFLFAAFAFEWARKKRNRVTRLRTFIGSSCFTWPSDTTNKEIAWMRHTANTSGANNKGGYKMNFQNGNLQIAANYL